MTSPLQHPDALVVTKSSERSWPVRARFSRRGTWKNETMWNNIEKSEVLRSCEVRIFSHYDLEENGYSPDSCMLGNKTMLGNVYCFIWHECLTCCEDCSQDRPSLPSWFLKMLVPSIPCIPQPGISWNLGHLLTSRTSRLLHIQPAMSDMQSHVEMGGKKRVPNWRWPFLQPELYENPARSSKPPITEESTSHG